MFFSCKPEHSGPTIDQVGLDRIKKEYSPEAINYLYETVFYSDTKKQKLARLHKWKKDINISFRGTPVEEELNATIKILDSINALGLPVQLSITEDTTLSSVKLVFDDTRNFESLPSTDGAINAYGTFNYDSGEIKTAEIGIIRNPDKVEYTKKLESLILEELVQTLGVPGDSYSYPNSIFYEGKNYQNTMSALDREVVKLLYDSSVPPFYAREQFEEDFRDVLYTSNTNKELRAYLETQNFSVLEKIEKTCFYYDDVFMKLPQEEILVNINGAYQIQDSVYLEHLIQAINKINANLKLKLSSKKIPTKGTGIVLNFEINEDQKYTVEPTGTVETGQQMFPRILGGTTLIKYKVNETSITKKRNVISKIIYKRLGPLGMHDFDEDWYEYDGKTVKFKDTYRELIDIIYQDFFVSGYKKDQYNDLLSDLD
jgi:hypothetical protein